MSRWHKSSCHSPKVSVEDGLPCCESCGSSPNIPKLVSDQAGSSPPWAMPPDEKFGEMNLSWPETVLYRPQAQNVPRMDSREFKKTDTREGQDAPSPIYTRRLNDDEFRLLYLPAVDDESHPIYASLEAYQIDDCPEYETVSYCWGGENDDATLCKPIFLGDYWDVLLQTNNCWSMLRYLRPQTGIRVVWVDAICIHQKDHQERESQVTMMGSIYEGCLRAVVYLGDDVVRPQSNDNRTYPARRDLDKVSAAAVDLHQVLKMRYFQRVWVIQELIRAPMVVIPVRGVELIAGRRTATPDQVDWHETNAPWMRHICTGRPDPALRRILEQTKNSQSTDPRDKVFGLLGFLPERQKLRPNHLLSSLHIYVGTIAHMLLNEGHSHLLTEAAGCKAPSMIASWLPDGNISTIGEILRKVSDSILRDHVQSRSGLVKGFWEGVLELNPDWEIILLAKTDELRYGRHSEAFNVLETTLPPPGRPSVHPSTSALSLPLVYLWRSSSIPVKIHQVGASSCAYEMTASSCTLYICTPDASLDSAIGPEPTSVFLLKDSENPPFLLFMRRLHLDGSYRLIKCCSCYGIFLSRKPPLKSNLLSSKSRSPLIDDLPVPGTKKPRDKDVPFSRNSMPILYRTVYQVVSETELLRKESWEILQRIATKDDPLDPGTINSHILGLFQRLSNGPKPPFVDLYFNFLRQCCPDCCVEVRVHEDEALVFVTMDPKEWLTVHESLNHDWYNNVFGKQFVWGRDLDHPGPWYWARVPGSSDSFHQEGLDRWKIDFKLATHELSSWVTTTTDWNHGRDPAHSWFNSPRVTMVTKAEGLKEWLRTSGYFKRFPHLRVCSRLVNEDEITLATTAPKPEYRSIGVYDWPESFFDGEHIPGKVENISIF